MAVVLAGHNGSGKSTLWYRRLSDQLQMPLINADRMMLSILPEDRERPLPTWAQTLRDDNESWMRVAQASVEAFTVGAMREGLPFAFETVFSYWQPQGDGARPKSKIDKIEKLQVAGYFVLLIFVGLANVELSIARVLSRVARGGHNVPEQKLRDRFPRTQAAISAARKIADATLMFDNSGDVHRALTLVRAEVKDRTLFDARSDAGAAPFWLPTIVPERQL